MNDTTAKPILCLDFDGVIHSYTSGWKGIDVIPDPPVDHAAVMIALYTDFFEVHIFSSRSRETKGIVAMQEYMKKAFEEHFKDLDPDLYSQFEGNVTHWTELLDRIQWPTEKPPAAIGLDDRVITFEGYWPPIQTLGEFKPWNRRDRSASNWKSRLDIEAEQLLVRAQKLEGFLQSPEFQKLEFVDQRLLIQQSAQMSAYYNTLSTCLPV